MQKCTSKMSNYSFKRGPALLVLKLHHIRAPLSFLLFLLQCLNGAYSHTEYIVMTNQQVSAELCLGSRTRFLHLLVLQP